MFNSYAFGGKHVPKVEGRISNILDPRPPANDVADAVIKMKEIARRNNLPPPKARKV